MNNKLYIIIAFLLFTFLCDACKNKAVDYYRFGISEEQIQPESNRVVVSGTYSFDGEVNGMKLNLGCDEKLTDAASYLVNLEGCNFSVSIDSLKPNTLYYYCYSVDFGLKNKYLTDIKSFRTLQEIPMVETIEVIAVDDFSCQVKCVVTSDGGADITERGVYWNTTGEPDINDHKVKHSENGLYEYVCQMDSLEPNTIYFIRAYAKNIKGTGFGIVVEFQTGNAPELPTVITSEVSEITATSAQCGGEVTNDGGNPVSSRGVCWNTEHNPTIDNNFTVDGLGLGSFDSFLNNLTPNATYYVRAYATNCYGTGYGVEVSFSSMDGLPEVVTLDVTDLGENTAVGHGKVTDEGASAVTERGICWGLNHNPDLNDNHEQSGTGLGEFEVTMTDLLPNKTYYVRAYSINTQGTVYGNEESFIIENTIIIEKPTVVIDSVGNISINRATVYASLTNDGSDAITELGIYWGTNPNPILEGDHVHIDVSNLNFTVHLNTLSPSTTYYVQAFATNSAGTGYSDVIMFHTTVSIVVKPMVITHEVSNITSTTAVCGGTVTNNGGAEVTECGLCWSTHPNPDIYSDDTIHCINGLNDFSGTIVGLSPGTTYYLNAYAINSAGPGYGNPVQFTTSERPVGALMFLFSVGDNKKVWFSKGNLQYLATAYPDSAWRFAENQWDCADNDNSIRDLFGWGTSGFNHGATCYLPLSNDIHPEYYYAYGNPSCHLYQGNGQADWGYNAITNGGYRENMGWRTLTYDEWNYLLTQRQTNSGMRFVKATVMTAKKDICGLIILPDDWETSFYSFNSINSQYASFDKNKLNTEQWDLVEEKGAVFLPAAGTRTGTSITQINSVAYYWSASNKSGGVTAYYLYISASHPQTIPLLHDSERSNGRAVRLVYDKP